MAEQNEAMQIEEDTGTTEQVIDSESLIDSLTSEQTEEQPEQPTEEQPAEEEQASPEQAQRNAIQSGITALYEDGWTEDELTAFSKDAKARADIKAGKDFMRVANAYLMRQMQAEKPAGGKRGVGTIKSATTAGVNNGNRIEDMTDKQFEEFSRRAYEAAMSGKKVKM
jgi:hypothetical protein